jgi:hypothetical protein
MTWTFLLEGPQMSGPVAKLLSYFICYCLRKLLFKNITKHDKVWRISMHIILLQTAVKQLDITTSTVNVLFMLDGELKD